MTPKATRRRQRILEAIFANPSRTRKSVADQFGVSADLVKLIAAQNKIRYQPKAVRYSACATCDKQITLNARFCSKHRKPERHDLDEDIKRLLTTTNWGKEKIGKNLGCGTSMVQREAEKLKAAGVKFHPARRRGYVAPPPKPKSFKTNAQLAAGIRSLSASRKTHPNARAGLQRKLKELSTPA